MCIRDRGEDLEAAGVGEQGARPGHEAVQATETADGLVAGAEVEVIGVGEEDVGASGVRADLFEEFVGCLLYTSPCICGTSG